MVPKLTMYNLESDAGFQLFVIVAFEVIAWAVLIAAGLWASLGMKEQPRGSLLVFATLSVWFFALWIFDFVNDLRMPGTPLIDHVMTRHEMSWLVRSSVASPLAWFAHINWWYLQPAGQFGLLLWCVAKLSTARNSDSVCTTA
jgi:hypothetical protein